MGGQSALNLAVKLSESDFLKRNKVELIGADLKAINKAEDRKLFKESMEKIDVMFAHLVLLLTLLKLKRYQKKLFLTLL